MKFTIRMKGGSGSGNFGHRGREGEVGGSAPEGGGGGIGGVPPPLDLFNVRSKTAEETSFTIGIMDPTVTPNVSWSDADRVLTEYADETGINIDAIRAVSRASMFQPVLSSYAGGHIVESVSRTFGIKIDPGEQERLDQMREQALRMSKKSIKNDYIANGFSFDHRPLSNDEMDHLVLAVYDRTQKELASRGITSLTLYRGAGEGAFSNVLSSWSASQGVASKFGPSRVVEIPANRIWAMPLTGFGVGIQLEALVLDEFS